MKRRPAKRMTTIALSACAILVPAIGVTVMATPSSADADPVVRTEYGEVRGADAGATTMYSGIRYAAPPVGPLRWKEPEPPEPWEGIADATKPGAPCVQDGTQTAGNKGSEDCLFVNVTKPKDHKGPLPVMVWLHGGGFTGGDGASYDAKRMAEQGNVMVVSVNYRLGVFGYFGHPGLAGSGDFGFADQIEALRWTQRNAAAFGGDNGNVTVFGQSAGAMSTCGLLTSPAATGLFHKAIMSSGSCAQDWPDGGMTPDEPAQAPYAPLAKTEADGKALAEELNADSVEALRDIPADALLPHSPKFKNHLTYDTPLLPMNPAKALRLGLHHRVPVMFGTTHDETRPLINGIITVTGPITEQRYLDLLRVSYGDRAGEVAAQYPPAEYGSPAAAYAAVTTDRSWAIPTREAQNSLVRHGSPVYAYEYNDPDAPNLSGPADPDLPMRAGHAHDLPSLFDLGGYPWPFTPDQQHMADSMVGYWTSFAHNGDPNKAGAPYWPRFDTEGTTLNLVPGAIGQTDYAAGHKYDFWQTMR